MTGRGIQAMGCGWRRVRGLMAVKCSNCNRGVGWCEMCLHPRERWGSGWMARLHLISSDGEAFNMHTLFHILPVNSKIRDGSRTNKKQNKTPWSLIGRKAKGLTLCTAVTASPNLTQDEVARAFKTGLFLLTWKLGSSKEYPGNIQGNSHFICIYK